jgi:(p)ppGpp synthase/HD superfamily hydrolase
MDYSEPCKYSIRLIEKLKSLDTKNILDFGLINKAIYWAKKYHGDQKRKSGEPYYSHPLEVAYMISEHKLKTDVIVASILHDIIEDTEVTVGMIFDNFSWRIAQMVDMLTRDRPDGTKLTIEEVITNAYKKADKEVLLIKLIDRLHNIQTIESMSAQKIEKIIAETLTNFIASSMYLGLLEIEQQLTESCMYTEKQALQKKVYIFF